MRILFATDGSAPAREGEKTISCLFDRAASDVTVLTVAPEPAYEMVLPDEAYAYGRLDVPVFDPERVAKEGAARLETEGFTVSSRFSRGSPATEILRELEEGDYDLVVTGASHTTWIGYALLGSVSMKVVHHSPVSVIVAHRAPSGAGRILVGTDGSEDSGYAMEVAANVLDRARCKIEVASVVGHPFAGAAYPPVAFTAHSPGYEMLERRRVEHARQVARRACGVFAANGFEVDEEVVLVGRTASQLLKEVENVGADLVVVGSRGLGAFKRAALGSVSDQVLRHAPATLVGRPPR